MHVATTVPRSFSGGRAEVLAEKKKAYPIVARIRSLEDSSFVPQNRGREGGIPA
jgi:hypothetical protein